MLRRDFLRLVGVAGFSAVARLPNSVFGETDFFRPVYSVAKSRVSWTASHLTLQVGALVYYPANPQEVCPVIIYSHGLGGSPERFAYLGNMWASRGFVSVFLHHPETDETQWRGKIRVMSELRELYRQYWAARDRALAVSFVIDRLSDPGSESASFAPIIDLSHLGVSGNDLGALASLLLAGQIPPDGGPSLKDSRVTAIAPFSPPVFCDAAHAPLVYENITVPCMTVAGTNDNGVVGATRAWQRRIPFDAMLRNDRYHVILNGGDHLVYSGHLRTRKQLSDADYQNAIRSVTTLFWSAYLRGDPTALDLLNIGTDTVFSRWATIQSRRAAKMGSTVQ
ncbi:MAG: alpha/beta hydrolase family protein [Thermoguttaceae bacterium]|jgi:predicted dienelactone hydrolase